MMKMGFTKRLLLFGVVLTLAAGFLGATPAGALTSDPCLGIDANGDGAVDEPPAPGSDCILLTNFVIEPKKPQPIVDLAFHTIHAGFMKVPEFDPARLVESSLTFGDADTPANRANPPVTSRCKSALLNGDNVQDKICKWWTTDAGVESGDTSACVTGITIDGYKIEGCGPLTTINGPGPSLSINDTSVVEGPAGASPVVTFVVSLSPAAASDVTVVWSTANGTAVAPGDYEAASGSLTFAAGETSKQIPVNVVGDDTPESTETFTVVLSSPVGASITDGSGTGAITSDDAAVTSSLTINDISVVEGTGNDVVATFTVTLSSASVQQVTVDYQTVDGAAFAPGDYTSTSGTLTFAPGEVTKTIQVTTIGDSVDERDEPFTVKLTNVVGATVADNSGRCIIKDNDP